MIPDGRRRSALLTLVLLVCRITESGGSSGA